MKRNVWARLVVIRWIKRSQNPDIKIYADDVWYKRRNIQSRFKNLATVEFDI